MWIKMKTAFHVNHPLCVKGTSFTQMYDTEAYTMLITLVSERLNLPTLQLPTDLPSVLKHFESSTLQFSPSNEQPLILPPA